MTYQETPQADIVIIGGGGGGLAAALAAAEKGSSVIVLEKRDTAGGNVMLANGIFAAESPVQKRKRIDASVNGLFKTAMGYSHWKTNPRIVRAFMDKSGDTIRWLEERGLKFEDIGHLYPNQSPRVYHMPEGRGASLVKLLVGKCEELGVRLLYATAAKKILTDENGHVTGVFAASKEKDFRIIGKTVIISTGGYSGNKELLKKHYPAYTEDLCVYGIPHMGDGLLLATEIGAATEGLGVLQLVGPHFPGSWAIDTAASEPNTMWVNKNGERFVDEAIGFLRPEGANALSRQPESISFAVFDDAIKQFFMEKGVIKGASHFPPQSRLTGLDHDLHSEAVKGNAKISYSWEEMAQWMGAVPETLRATAGEYNRFCDEKNDGVFSKDPRYLFPLRTAPYYAVRCHQALHTTMGGIKINHHMEVLDEGDNPIPGLYAAGNDTGGSQPDTYCLILAGSTLGFALNSGRIAGENAAKYAGR